MKKVLLVLVLAVASLSVTTDANASVFKTIHGIAKSALNSKLGKNLTSAGVDLAVAGLSGQPVNKGTIAAAGVGALAKTVEQPK